MAGLSHRLAAVWFADVVGYSRLMSENEGDAVAAVRLLQVVCREIVPASGGASSSFWATGRWPNSRARIRRCAPRSAYAARMDPATPATWAPMPADESARVSEGILAKLGAAALPIVVFLYLVASWIVVQLTRSLIESFGLPDWLAPVALGLLLVRLVIVSATAWVQTRTRTRMAPAPGAWDLALGDAGRSLARGRLPHLTWSRAIAGGVFAFSLLFGLAGLYVVIQDRGRSFSPDEAVPYYESITNTPLPQLELGKIYEGLGDREKALAAYEEFVNAFDRPDPEVVALAEEGRQGVIRMKGLRREEGRSR